MDAVETLKAIALEKSNKILAKEKQICKQTLVSLPRRKKLFERVSFEISQNNEIFAWVENEDICFARDQLRSIKEIRSMFIFSPLNEFGGRECDLLLYRPHPNESNYENSMFWEKRGYPIHNKLKELEPFDCYISGWHCPPWYNPGFHIAGPFYSESKPEKFKGSTLAPEKVIEILKEML